VQHTPEFPGHFFLWEHYSPHARYESVNVELTHDVGIEGAQHEGHARRQVRRITFAQYSFSTNLPLAKIQRIPMKNRAPIS
jgi:hypothetical protein